MYMNMYLYMIVYVMYVSLGVCVCKYVTSMYVCNNVC